ncbi:MAG: ribosome maturation factor RimM [Polyangiales bacterium]
MAKPADDDWVPLAVVGRPHGVKGEVRAHAFNKDSALLLDLDEVLVRFVEGDRKGEAQEVTIDGARTGNDAILVKLADVDDRNAADELRGAQLCVKRRDFPPLEEGEFYACDIIGAKAFDEAGNELGTVRNFTSYPSVDILLVETPKGRFEVPLIDPYVERVEPENGRVVLRTLEGLDPS